MSTPRRIFSSLYKPAFGIFLEGILVSSESGLVGEIGIEEEKR